MESKQSDELVALFFSTFRIFKHKLDLSNPIFQLPPAQMEALRLVSEQKQILMKELADLLAITPPSATALVNSLAKLGYVKRINDKRDRRTVHIKLTPKGQISLEKGMKERCLRMTKLLENLSKKEKVELLNILKKMIK